MTLYNARRPRWLFKACVLALLTVWAVLTLASRKVEAEDTARSDFIQACVLNGGSAVTRFKSSDVFCAARPANVYVEHP